MRAHLNGSLVVFFLLVIISLSFTLCLLVSGESNIIQWPGFSNQLRELPSQGSHEALYLDQLQLIENETVSRNNIMPGKVYEEYESGELETPFVADNRLSLFKNMKLRPAPAEMESSLTNILNRKIKTRQESAEVYFDMMKQIDHYESMPVDARQLIQLERKAWLGDEQVHDLIASFEKKQYQLKLPVKKYEMKRIKRFYENLSLPEYQLPPAILTMARNEYLNMLLFLNLSSEIISQKMQAFDLKLNSIPLQIQAYTIRSAEDLYLAEQQLREDLAAQGERRFPKNLFQEHEFGDYYDPVVDGFQNTIAFQPTGLLLDRLEKKLKMRLESLGISETIIRNSLGIQSQYFISLPEFNYYPDLIKERDYLIIRKLTSYEIPIFADAIKERSKIRRLPESRIQKQINSFFNYQKRPVDKSSTDLIRGENFFQKAILRQLKTVMKTAGYSESVSNYHLLEMQKVLDASVKN